MRYFLIDILDDGEKNKGFRRRIHTKIKDEGCGRFPAPLLREMGPVRLKVENMGRGCGRE